MENGSGDSLRESIVTVRYTERFNLGSYVSDVNLLWLTCVSVSPSIDILRQTSQYQKGIID